MIKNIIIYEKTITVSSDGRIYDDKGVEKRQQTYPEGYKYVAIAGHNCLVHRLVARAFLENYSEDLVVHHINGDKTDNRVENLMLMTDREHHIFHQQILPLKKICEICGKEFTPNPTKRRRAHVCSNECKIELDKIHAAKRQRPINQFSKDGILIKQWESATCVYKELGYERSNINKCCNGHIQSYKGYVWEYA